MISNQDILNNLYDFYSEIAGWNDLKTKKSSEFIIVKRPENDWPSFLLGGEQLPASDLKILGERMKKDEIPGFWIRQEDEKKIFDEIVKGFGIRQISQWKGMMLEKSSPFLAISPDRGLSFERINNEENLVKWLQIVNKEVMGKKKISSDIFMPLLRLSVVDIFQLCLGEKIISTILMYTRNGITGIYFVCTKEKYRSKGFGSFIISSAIDYCIQKANTKFVLHSTNAGYPVYQKLGFERICDIGIYWMLGKM